MRHGLVTYTYIVMIILTFQVGYTPLMMANNWSSHCGWLWLIIMIILTLQEAWVGYILLVMASYWSSLCVPLWVTGLIPVFAFPFMQILTVSEVASQYMKVSLTFEPLPRGLPRGIDLRRQNLTSASDSDV